MWQQRIYAFILRRLLGPYLTPQSRNRLHESINISLREGRLELLDIDLDGPGLASKLNINVQVHRAHVRKLCVSLSMVNDSQDHDNDNHYHNHNHNHNHNHYHNADATNTTNQNTPGTGARLVATVHLDGLNLQIGPSPSSDTGTTPTHGHTPTNESSQDDTTNHVPTTTTTTTTTTTSRAKGAIQSYVQAALDSLKLSISITNLCITMSSSAHEGEREQPHITLRVAATSYRDLTISTELNGDQSTGGRARLVIGKHVCVSGVTLNIAGDSLCLSKQDEELLKMDGQAKIKFWVLSLPSITDEVEDEKTRMQRFCEIIIDQRVFCNIHVRVFQYINHFASDVAAARQTTNTNCTKDGSIMQGAAGNGIKCGLGNDFGSQDSIDHNACTTTEEHMEVDDDEEDMGLLSNILRQQEEAHRLASTQEVRGGLLLPDFSSLNVQENTVSHSDVERNNTVVTFDAFFDANDEGFSHFLTTAVPHSSCTGSDDNFDSSQVTLYLKEMSISLHLDGSVPTDHYNCTTDEHDTVGGAYVMLRLGDCNVVSRESHNTSDLSVGIGFLEIEDGDLSFLRDGRHQRTLHKDSVLHFVEEELTENQVLSPTECISIMNTTKEIGKTQRSTEVVIKMAPLQLYYKNRTVANIKAIIDLIALQMTNSAQMSVNKERKDPSSSIETSLHVNLKCDHITASLPLQHDGAIEFLGGDTKSHASIERFFERSGYSVEYPDGLSRPVFSVVVSELSANVSRAIPSDDSTKGKVDYDVLQNDFSILCTCQKFLFSISAPFCHRKESSVSASDSVYAYRMDFLSLESETQIDPNAIIKLEFTRTAIDGVSEVLKRKRAKKFFPVVTQLSFVKASQQHESEDIDKTYQSYDREGQNFKSANLRPTKSTIRGSDPQAVMLKEASRCGSYVSVHVPSIVADLSSREIVDLVKFITQLTDEFVEAGEKPHSIGNIDANIGVPSTGLTFRCDQFSIALHEDDNAGEDSEEKDKKVYSQIFICDGIHAHCCMLQSYEIKNTRFICDDITLDEVSNLVSNKSNSAKYSSNLSVKSSISYRCDLIRRRRVEHSLHKVGSAIFFRSKLSHPLSPKTPALLIDTMIKRDGDDIERALHISLYDLTYRYEVDSQWIDRLKIIFKVDKLDKDDITLESKAPKEDIMTQSVTKLFITVSDCNFDYTSPAAFNTASSTIIRVGEVRISSNLIIPAGLVQAFKVSVADVALFLSNKRSTHDIENSRLSCSNLIFDSSKHCAISSLKYLNNVLPQSFEDALYKMNFISISTLDYLDAAIATTQFNEEDTFRYQDMKCGDKAPPDMIVTLSIGKVCLSTCKDSFTCLSETVGDMILKLSTPTPEELKVIQLQNATDKKGNLVAECSSHTVTEVEPHNDGSKEEVSASAYDGNSSSLAEVVGHDLFPNIDGMSEVSSELLHVGADEVKTLKNLASVNFSMNETYQMESQNGQKRHSNSNEGVLFKNKTVMIHDFYAVEKKDGGLSDGTATTDANRIGDTSQRSLVGHWTTVDYSWTRDSSVPASVEQCGGWYSSDEDADEPKENLMNKSQVLLPNNVTVIVEGKDNGNRVPQVFPRHVLINPVSDPLAGGDMGASKFANTKSSPRVKLRIMVKEMSVCCRFFDGYDWKAPNKLSFTHSTAKQNNGKKASDMVSLGGDSKTQLMCELLGDNLEGRGDRMFEEPELNTTLPAATECGTKRKCRQPHRLFQFSYCGLKLRCDLFTDCADHCLASCMDLSLRDMFVSETISSGVPVKIIGEWANNHEHPRDSHDGLLMMKVSLLIPCILLV